VPVAGRGTVSNNSTIAPGASYTITVTFQPTAAGMRAATVTDNVANRPHMISVNGTGMPSAVSLSPTSLSFGSEEVEMVSYSQVVTLSKMGGARLSIAGQLFTGANAGDFSEVDTCSPSVPAGGTCTIAILFPPAASGTWTAALSINAGKPFSF
jgi:trimeric autotransporter adhesin